MKMKSSASIPKFDVDEFLPKNSKYCILIPIINEGERIKTELERACKKGIGRLCDIVICDGGSNDGSTNEELLKSLGVNTLLVKRDTGKQSAQLRMGMYWALKRGYDGIITIDGNNKDSIESVPAFVDKLKQGYDFVQGSRFMKGGKEENTPKIRKFAVKVLHAPLISNTAGKKYTDTTNAFRAYSKKYLENPLVDPFRDIFKTYELLAYLSVRADQLGLRTCEIPVERVYPKNEKAPTKISPFKGNLELLKILILNFFGRYAPKVKKEKQPIRNTISNAIVVIICTLTIFMGFFMNIWRAADITWFDDWQMDSQSLVLGRMQLTKTQSADVHSGLLVSMGEEEQIEAYLVNDNMYEDDGRVYTRQYGLQGRFFGTIANISPFSPEVTLNICYAINSAVMTFLLMLLIVWLYKEFGIGAGVFAWLAILSSSWLAVSTRNLYWCTWTIILPMLCVLFLLKHEEKTRREHNIILFVITFFTIFIRAACGYEFISSVMILAEAPLVYYAVKSKMPVKKYVKRACIIAIAAVAGFIAAVLIHLSATSQVLGGFSFAWQDFIESISNRTGMFNTDLSIESRSSVNKTADVIINKYLYEGRAEMFGWHMGSIIPFVIIFSILAFFKGDNFKTLQEDKAKNKSMVVMLGILLLAPISWFVLSKGHSYIHPHINHILWCLPFLIIAVSFCGSVIWKMCSEMWKNTKNKKWHRTIIATVCVVSALFFTCFNSIEKISNTIIVNTTERRVSASAKIPDMTFYKFDDKIYYIGDRGFDYSKKFFAIITAENSQDLNKEDQDRGYEKVEFSFDEYEKPTMNLSDKRLAELLLPTDYEIRYVKIGQIGEDGWLWELQLD